MLWIMLGAFSISYRFKKGKICKNWPLKLKLNSQLAAQLAVRTGGSEQKGSVGPWRVVLLEFWLVKFLKQWNG